MSQKTLFRFKVVGWGAFPTDMLRYDHCWPSQQDDVRMVDMQMTRDNIGDYKRLRTIELIGISQPTKERWESFDWSVVVPVTKFKTD